MCGECFPGRRTRRRAGGRGSSESSRAGTTPTRRGRSGASTPSPEAKSGRAFGSSVEAKGSSKGSRTKGSRPEWRPTRRGGGKASEEAASFSPRKKNKTRGDAFSEMMRAAKAKEKDEAEAKAKTSQTSPSPSAKRPTASAPPWARGLVDACARPDSTAGVIRHDDRLVVMRDKYPKGETHLSCSRAAAEFADARGVAALEPRHAPLARAMLAAGREAVADLKRNKNERAAAAAAEGAAAAADRTPERSSSGSASLFRLGFHAKPSMPQLHMHVVSQDLRGAGMKTRRHWGSFARRRSSWTPRRC